MEKALQRRIEKQVQNGRLRAAATSDATELLESFTDTMEQLHGEAIPATNSDSAA
ncbi:trimeric intracellular cation channel family protein, partial [Bacteroides fragilis]|nr:trimeric intracellular cation channel family protein [Bacteroides fragilis]